MFVGHIAATSLALYTAVSQLHAKREILRKRRGWVGRGIRGRACHRVVDNSPRMPTISELSDMPDAHRPGCVWQRGLPASIHDPCIAMPRLFVVIVLHITGIAERCTFGRRELIVSPREIIDVSAVRVVTRTSQSPDESEVAALMPL